MLLRAYRGHRLTHQWFEVDKAEGKLISGLAVGAQGREVGEAVLPVESESFRLRQGNSKIFIWNTTPYINFCSSGKVPSFYNFDLQVIFILRCEQWICRTWVHVTIHKHQESSERFWSPKFYSLKTTGGWGGPGGISLHFQLRALTTNRQWWPERLLPALATALRWLAVMWLPACWLTTVWKVQISYL